MTTWSKYAMCFVEWSCLNEHNEQGSVTAVSAVSLE